MMGLISFKSFFDLSPTNNLRIFPSISLDNNYLKQVKYTTCLSILIKKTV